VTQGQTTWHPWAIKRRGFKGRCRVESETDLYKIMVRIEAIASMRK